MVNGAEIPQQPYSTSDFRGNATGDFLNIKQFNGASAFLNVPATVIRFTDEVEATEEETFTSGYQAYDRLKEVGFFVDSTAGGGGGSTDIAFKDLTDVNVSSFVAYPNYVVSVNEAGTALVLTPRVGVNRIQDALDWAGGALQPDKYVLTNSAGTGFIQGNIEQIINKPIAVDEFRVVAKGANYDEGTDTWIANIEPFAKEIGDWCEGVSSTDGKRHVLVYNGGDETDIANYTKVGYWAKP